jgi:iron(III) transport system permease protein
LSKPLVSCALIALFVLGLLPVVVMAGGITWADVISLFEARNVALLGRTIGLGLGAAALALVFGLPFGFLVARTNMPGAALLRPMGAIPLFLPSLFIAIAWAPLVDLRGGLAAALVLGFSTFPLVALFSARAFERIDAAKEEAALMAGGLKSVLRMELPLVLPSALAGASIAFAFAVNDFATPDYVSSVGPKFNVYADEIFASWNVTSNPGRALVTALPLIALTLLTLIPALALRRKGNLATQGSAFRAPGALDLGALRIPALLFALVPLSVGALVPIGRLFIEAGGVPAQLEGGGSIDFGAVWTTLQDSFGLALERAREDLLNSILFSTCAALIAVPIGLILGHAIERTSRRFGRILELLGMLPLALPAILFGIAAVFFWSTPATADLYDSGTMAVLLFAGRYVSFPILLLAGATASLDRRLEESAAISGAGPIRRLCSIVTPELRGSIAGSFVLVFVFCMRELDSAILVPAANHTAILRVFNGVHFGRDEYVAALALLLIFAILLPGALWTLFAKKRLEVLR